MTSKISWNDTNRMPYDVFRWRGIDGTEINTRYITAQKDKGGPSDRYCTYVGHVTSQMVSGTYKRFGQKQLSDEARKNGTADMTLEEINAEISSVRREHEATSEAGA